MYDIIYRLIGHEYVSSYSGDQQYIYSACIAVIVVLTIALLRWFAYIFRLR